MLLIFACASILHKETDILNAVADNLDRAVNVVIRSCAIISGNLVRLQGDRYDITGSQSACLDTIFVFVIAFECVENSHPIAARSGVFR